MAFRRRSAVRVRVAEQASRGAIMSSTHGHRESRAERDQGDTDDQEEDEEDEEDEPLVLPSRIRHAAGHRQQPHSDASLFTMPRSAIPVNNGSSSTKSYLDSSSAGRDHVVASSASLSTLSYVQQLKANGSVQNISYAPVQPEQDARKVFAKTTMNDVDIDGTRYGDDGAARMFTDVVGSAVGGEPEVAVLPARGVLFDSAMDDHVDGIDEHVGSTAGVVVEDTALDETMTLPPDAGGNESDEADRDWEDEQLRRATGGDRKKRMHRAFRSGDSNSGPSDNNAPDGRMEYGDRDRESTRRAARSWRALPQLTTEVTHSSTLPGGPPPLLFTPTPRVTPDDMLAELEVRLSSEMERVEQLRRSVAQARDNLLQNVQQQKLLQNEQLHTVQQANDYVEITDYICDLCACLQHKIRRIDDMEDRLRKCEDQASCEIIADVAPLARRKTLTDPTTLESCAYWSDDAAHQMIGQLADLPSTQGMLEMLGTQKAVDSERSLVSLLEQRRDILVEAQGLMDDVADEFRSADVILDHFDEWLRTDSETYRRAKVDEKYMPDLIAPFFRLRLLNWNPILLAPYVASTAVGFGPPALALADVFESFNALVNPAVPASRLHLFPELVEHLVFPKLIHMISQCFAVFSRQQSLQIVESISAISNVFQPAGLPDASSEELWRALYDVCHKAVDEVCTSSDQSANTESFAALATSLRSVVMLACSVVTFAAVAPRPMMLQLLMSLVELGACRIFSTITRLLTSPPLPTADTQRQFRSLFLREASQLVFALAQDSGTLWPPLCETLRNYIDQFQQASLNLLNLDAEERQILQSLVASLAR